MVEEVHVADMRHVLQSVGIKPRHIKKFVVKAIRQGELAQKSKDSPTLTAGTSTIEQFMDVLLHRFQKSYTTTDVSILTPSARKFYYSVSTKTESNSETNK